MGCGASSFGAEGAEPNRHSDSAHQRHRVVRPITDEPVKPLPPPSKDDDVQRDDAITGPGSPSFREYCTDFDSRCPTTEEHNNVDDVVDDSDSGESTNNNSGIDDSTVSKSQPNKENEKKERKGRRLKDVIYKGRSGGGKKMSSARHRSVVTDSEASFNSSQEGGIVTSGIDKSSPNLAESDRSKVHNWNQTSLQVLAIRSLLCSNTPVVHSIPWTVKLPPKTSPSNLPSSTSKDRPSPAPSSFTLCSSAIDSLQFFQLGSDTMQFSENKEGRK
ncbi:dentin sialophosphoprotein-like [Senna tora]|uniref:Dentin sialophosphoprotein-like n=1 Tax=Senna tora TaxID=362788 RepID=A0A834SGF8_9FABA|nr:dentin sialophosphoprotein-like [Senna tora]